MKKLFFGIVAGSLLVSGCGSPSTEATPTTTTIPQRPTGAPAAAGTSDSSSSASVAKPME